MPFAFALRFLILGTNVDYRCLDRNGHRPVGRGNFRRDGNDYRQRHWRGYLDLPTGRTAFLDPVPYEKYRWISERTHSSEPLFGDQLVSFALGLRDPAEIAFITPDDYTRPEQVTNLIQALERERVRYVLWYPDLDSPPSAAGDHLEPLRAYLRGRYHVARVFADGDRIWDRN